MMATIHKTDSSPFRKNTHRKKANVSIMDDPKLHSIAFNCFVHSQSPIDPNWTMKMKMGILADSNYTNEEDQHPCRSRLRNEEGEHHPCRCGLCNEEDEHVLVDPNWAVKKMSLLADPKLRNEEEDEHVLVDPNWAVKKMSLLADPKLRNEEEDELPCRSKFHNEEDEHPGCSTEAWWKQRCNTRLHKSFEEQEEKMTLSEIPLGFFCLRL
jgi:hypothetical protein